MNASIAKTGTKTVSGADADRRARLKRLRAELTARGLDGFIVPRADEHQGEYVAGRSERLAWLTGFTGSAGLAVVLKNKAAVFVDGRYTLQVRAQVDTAQFDCLPIATHMPWDWIAGAMSKGGRIGYDPWLLTPAQAARYEAACKKAGGKLVPVPGNLVDAVWADQPPPPRAPAQVHPNKYAGRTSADKRREIAVALKSAGEDAAVLSAPDSICWLLNVRGADVPRTPFVLSFAVVHRTGAVDWCVDADKITAAVRRHIGKEVRLHAPGTLGDVLDRLGQGGKRVRIDPAGIPMWVMARLKRAGADISRAADPCQLPKAKKTRAEQAGMRSAHKRDGAAVCRFLAWLAAEAPQGGITELAASDRLLACREATGKLRDLSFDTISGSGPNGAIVHYKSTPETNRTLKPGDIYLVDSGGQYLDGTTDITRTVAITIKGKKGPTREMQDRFTRVLKGHIALAMAKFPPGTTGSALDPLARKSLWDAGLDYDHGTGHGVGSYLSVHEGPQRISKAASTVALEPGMVVSNEPGYYKTGEYGIRIENLVMVGAAETPRGGERDMLGFETLTLAPIDRALIDTPMLDTDERAWLDAYHARVWRELNRAVDARTRAWLKSATKPL
ncbi:MAG: aminopeptidase P family protein [Rhodospirillaceae bacterium]